MSGRRDIVRVRKAFLGVATYLESGLPLWLEEVKSMEQLCLGTRQKQQCVVVYSSPNVSVIITWGNHYRRLWMPQASNWLWTDCTL